MKASDLIDREAVLESSDTPEDVANLYSWANLHWAKYRDFSASRAQTREKARQRVQEAIEAERRRTRDEAEAQKQAEANDTVEAAILAEAQRKSEEAARERALKTEQVRTSEAARPAIPPSNVSYQPAPADFSHGQPHATPSSQPPPREEQSGGRGDYFLQVRNPWGPAETREAAARPAWLSATDHSEASAQSALSSVPDDTLQASRDRLTSRWFALNRLFNGGSPASEPVPAASTQRAPVLAVFSLAGGVGKTSLVATLGRALSARGERVLLVDTAAFGLLPFFFGASDQRPGVLRTFTAPTTSGDAPIQMISVDPESFGPEAAPQETLAQEISRHSRNAVRVIVDIATASGATTRRVLRMSPTLLVPVMPDLSSVVSVRSIESFLQHNVSASGQPVRPYYVLNQFDPSLPLHLDIREVLRDQVGDRLLPFVLRRAPAVSEALAEGMTVVDYAPTSPVAEDYGSLAGWVRSVSAPAAHGFRGVRWSER